MTQESAQPTSQRYTPPWLFLLLMTPSGISQGFGLVALPYWLTKAGMAVDQVSTVVALAVLPASWKPFLAPLIDLGQRRRIWFVAGASLAALSLLMAFFALRQAYFGALSGCLLTLNAAISLSEDALLSLCVTTVRPADKGRSAGFYSMGQLCYGGIFGWLMLTLRDPPQTLRGLVPQVPLFALGLGFACWLFIAAFVALGIDESNAAATPSRAPLRVLLRDVWSVVGTRSGMMGLLICLAPLGTGAASNLFGSLAPAYHVNAAAFGLVSGLGAMLANAVGSTLGGLCTERVGSRGTYLVGALLLGLCAMGMAISPHLPGFFIVTSLAYGVAGGFAYAAFYALVFDHVRPTASASSVCGIFVGASNLAVFYVTLLEGQMYRRSGTTGLLVCDALCNIGGILLVLALFRALRARTPA